MSNIPMFIIRDASGAIYGPADITTLRQWITEGRITPLMEIAPQGTATFAAAAQFPDLVSAFAMIPAPAGAPPGSHLQTSYYPPTQQQYLQPAYYPRTSGMAIASLICGICALACYGLPGIAAVILGHLARGQIKREPERYGGNGIATAGLILGYCWCALIFIALVIIVVVVIMNPP
jgi:hypothetical protein